MIGTTFKTAAASTANLVGKGGPLMRCYNDDIL